MAISRTFFNWFCHFRPRNQSIIKQLGKMLRFPRHFETKNRRSPLSVLSDRLIANASIILLLSYLTKFLYCFYHFVYGRQLLSLINLDKGCPSIFVYEHVGPFVNSILFAE